MNFEFPLGTEKANALQSSIQKALCKKGYARKAETEVAEYIILLLSMGHSQLIPDDVNDDYDPTFTDWLFQEKLATIKGDTPTAGFASSSVSLDLDRPSQSPLQPRKRRATDREPEGSPSKYLRMESPCSDAPISQEAMEASEVPEDVGLQAIEDIGDQITMSLDHPSNVTGHFCDLFVGIHVTHGKAALKRPRVGPDQYTQEDLQRFMREADTWRGLKHDYVLSFIGTCRIDGYLYMVSPYIDNGTLSGFVEQYPEVDRARLLSEVAEAVAYLHRSGVIHGDIKGTNILVSNEIHALLCDFGLTKFADTSTSTALKSAGSLRWQSPELWEENRPKTYKSDTYAFGMTIAEVLSGRVPFANYQQPFGIVLAAGSRNERPPTEPIFSPTGYPYYTTWRAAIHCWTKHPFMRPSMEEVAQMLKPLEPPPSESPPMGSEMPPIVPIQRHRLLPISGPEHSEGPGHGPADLVDVDEGDEGEGSGEDGEYCYWRRDAFEPMICCQNSECFRGWFHPSCLGMLAAPTEPWYCLQCESARLITF